MARKYSTYPQLHKWYTRETDQYLTMSYMWRYNKYPYFIRLTGLTIRMSIDRTRSSLELESPCIENFKTFQLASVSKCSLLYRTAEEPAPYVCYLDKVSLQDLEQMYKALSLLGVYDSYQLTVLEKV